MARKLSILGLLTVLALATGAIGAATASAVTHTFHSGVETAHLTADSSGKQVYIAKAGDKKELVCKELTVDATVEGEEIAPGDYRVTEMTVTPTYSECGVYEGESFLASASFAANGCQYTFNGTTATTEATAGEYGSAQLTCPEGKAMTIKVSALNRECTHIEPQGLGGFQFENAESEGVKNVTVSMASHEVQAETTSWALVCETPTKEPVTDTSGTFKGEFTLTGFKDAEHEERAGLFTSADDTFHADGETAYLGGNAQSNQTFIAKAGDKRSVVCKEASLSGTLQGKSVGAEDYESDVLTVKPSYTECGLYEGESKIASANVTFNGCQYTFESETAEPEGGGEARAAMAIGCPEGVTGITVDLTGLNTQCIHITGGQTLPGVKYEDGIAEVEDITTYSSFEGVESVTTNNALVCPTESGETETVTSGTLSGDITVKGYSDEARTKPTRIWVE